MGPNLEEWRRERNPQIFVTCQSNFLSFKKWEEDKYKQVQQTSISVVVWARDHHFTFLAVHLFTFLAIHPRFQNQW